MAFCQFFSNTDIPELNRKILVCADSLVGKKIGKGICREFVMEVLSNSEVEIPSSRRKKDKQQWKTIYWKNVVVGLPASSDTIYAGDIIRYANHIAIVYKVLDPLNYVIVHQNFSGKLKYSHVGFMKISVPVLDCWYVSIFRPIPKISL